MSGFYLRADGVGFTYPGASQPALTDVSFEIKEGERVGIIGENGAGKSTLLQVLCGILPPGLGRIDVSGKVHAVLAVGMGLREEATGRENFFLDGLLMGRSRAETQAKLDELIDFAELGDFIDRPIRTYSTGMKARLGFASLVIVEPEILIIDEALGVGDAFFVNKATQAMKRLTDSGAIVIVVSHSLASIRDLCPRTLWMDQGQLRKDGPSNSVADAYRQIVHARMAEDAARKFGSSGQAWSKSADLEISNLQIVGRPDGGVRELAEAGEALALRATLTGVRAQSAMDLRIWAERNDGLIVFDERVALPGDEAVERSRTIHLDLGRLNWRAFNYQFHLECFDGAARLSHRAAAVKIWSEIASKGGTPMVEGAVGFDVTPA